MHWEDSRVATLLCNLQSLPHASGAAAKVASIVNQNNKPPTSPLSSPWTTSGQEKKLVYTQTVGIFRRIDETYEN